MSPYHLNKIVGNGVEDTAKKPIQKVTPSRSVSVSGTYQAPSNGVNGNHQAGANGNGTNGSSEGAYTKPNSPLKITTGILQHNNVPNLNNNSIKGANGHKPLTATVGYVNNTKAGQKTNK